MSRVAGIVAGRLGMCRSTREFSTVRARLRAEARKRHGATLRGASLWRRLVVRIRIEREVRAELDRIYPPGALYAAVDSR